MKHQTMKLFKRNLNIEEYFINLAIIYKIFSKPAAEKFLDEFLKISALQHKCLLS
jgi:hypothetical protein